MGGIAAALEMILRCPSLAAFEPVTFNVFGGGRPEIAGRKAPTPARIARRLGSIGALARHARYQRPQLVHFHFGSESFLDALTALLLMRAASVAGSRVILHLHVDPQTADLPGPRPFGQRLFRRLTNRVDAIFVLTEPYREHLLRCAVPQPVSVVPNMCDERLLALPVERRHGTLPTRVVSLGRLTPEKGIFDVVRLAGRLRRAGVTIHFEAAGSPTDAAAARRIRAAVDREGAGELVSLPGPLVGAEKAKLFARADILLAPSRWESFGLTAVEGMAAGLPVLGTTVAGLRSIVVDGETGYLTEPGDVEAMQRCLTVLAADPRLRLRMGVAGRRRFLERYSAAHVGPLIAATYQALLQAA
jgi:glycosyltransferase involved in cell wall biosynthesis